MDDALLKGGLRFLKTENLHLVDGGALQIALDREIKRAIDDVNDRPWLKKPRKVVLTISVDADYNEVRQDVDAYLVDFSVKNSHPDRGTSVKMSQGRNGGLVFSPGSPGNPDQMSFLDGDEA